jgi:hypothetical protein
VDLRTIPKDRTEAAAATTRGGGRRQELTVRRKTETKQNQIKVEPEIRLGWIVIVIVISTNDPPSGASLTNKRKNNSQLNMNEQ